MVRYRSGTRRARGASGEGLFSWLRRRLLDRRRRDDRSGQVLFTARGSSRSAPDRPQDVTEQTAVSNPPAPPSPSPPPPPAEVVVPPPSGPRVRVHEARLDRRVAPVALSPSEAVRLADEGHGSLPRRGLPPDPEGPGGS